MTFRDLAVLDAMARLEVCKLDIDEAANQDACQRYHDRDGVPAFVVLADGRIVHRWSGAGSAQTFCDELANAARLAQPPDPADPIAVAEFHCARGDRARVAEQLSVLARRGGAHDDAEGDRIEWLLCTTLAKQRRWSDLAAATQGYLAHQRDGAHRDAAEVLLGRATFALDGSTSAALQAHIDARLAECAVDAPQRSLLDRARNFAGLQDKAAEEAHDAALTTWVRTVNAAMDALTELGPPALPALRRALLGSNATAAEHAATVLGWMRLPENIVFLREQLAHGALGTASRLQVVRALAIQQDPTCMSLLLEFAGEANEPAVRAEAINGIRHLCMQTGGSSDPRVADALSIALRSRDRALREQSLQAMFEVRAPLELPALVAALRDRRGMFLDYRICDNALWILTHQIGRDVQEGDKVAERCTPEIAAFLAAWHARNEAQLRWDPAAQRWTGGEDDTTPAGR